MFSRLLAALWREGIKDQGILADVPGWRKYHGSATRKFYRKGTIFSSGPKGVVDN
jgi:hypothetical protein